MDAKVILHARRTAEENFDTRVLSGHVWNLTDEHFVEVVCWLNQRIPYLMVEELCQKELGLPAGKLPSKSALSRFWRDSGFKAILQRAKRLANTENAAEIAKEAERSGADLEAANIQLIQQTAHEMLSDGADVDTVKPFVAAVVKLGSNKIAQKRLEQQMQRQTERQQ